MKLIDLSLHGFRAFPPEEQPPLEFDGENCVIVGDNGTGKSSVLAAIEFLLTGGMAHLSGDGTGNLDIPTHAPHIEADVEECYVRGTFIADDGREGTFERQASDHTTLERLDGEIEVDEIDVAQWNSNHLILTRRRLLSFIEASASDRGDELSKLLNLRGVSNRSQGFRWIRNEIRRLAQEKRESIDRHLDDIASSLGFDIDYPLSEIEQADILRGVNEKLEVLEVSEIDDLDELPAALDSISYGNNSDSIDPFYQSSTEARLSSIEGWLGEQKESIEEEIHELADALADLEAEDQVSLDKIDLLEAANQLVSEETEICPLCGERHDVGYLHSKIESERENVEVWRNLRNEIREMRASLRTSISSHSQELDEILNRLNRGIEEGDHPDAREYIVGIRDYAEEIQRLQDLLEGNLVEQRDDGELIIHQISPDELSPDWDSIEDPLTEIDHYIDELPPLENRYQAYSDLDSVESAWGSLGEVYERHEQLETFSAECDRVIELFDEAKQEVLDALFEDIEGAFNDYYTTIHPDEQDIDLDFDANGTQSVGIEASFRGTRDDPLAYHSEGHVDTMGVCLFLALRDHLDDSGPNLVMLDDIVMSVDRAHRRALVRLLEGHLNDGLQGIITTHEEVWADQLFEGGVVNRGNRVEITDWDLSVGPVLRGRSGNPVWELARQYLSENKPHVAASHLRRQSEKICRQAAGSLQPEIRYQESYSLGSYIYALNAHISEICTAAKRENEDGSEVFESARSLDDQRSDLIGDPPRDELNRMVHYNRDEWGQLAAGDLEPIVNHWEAVEDLFQCDDCGGLLYTDEGSDWTWIQCECRGIQVGAEL